MTTLTIAVASYQRREHLARLLSSIAVSVASVPADVVVVLDGSIDGSREMVETWAERFPVPLRVIWQPNAGLAAARNAGIAAAAGELVWLLDDDMVVTRRALDAHLAWDRARAQLLMGPAEVDTSDPTVRDATWFYDDRHRRLASAGRVVDPGDCSFANTSGPTALFRSHPFDVAFRGYGIEDYELAVRFAGAGETIGFDAAAGVVHEYGVDRSDHLRRLREEGANRVRFAALHPDQHAIVFPSAPGRAERMLRAVAQGPAWRLLWPAATMVDRLARSRAAGPWRARLSLVATRAAVYSGVATALRAAGRGHRLSAPWASSSAYQYRDGRCR